MSKSDPRKPPPGAIMVASAMWDAMLEARGAAQPGWEGAGIMQFAFLAYSRAAIISLAEQGFLTKRGMKALEVEQMRRKP